ncbi:MAG: hypothetical protein AAB380_03200 [Verrucomicrobiota bacterium]
MRAPEVQPNPENVTPEELRVVMEAALNLCSDLQLNALCLKADGFLDDIARTPDALLDRLCTVLKSCPAQPDKTASICSIRK